MYAVHINSGGGAIHWSTDKVPGATPLEKIDSFSPEAINCLYHFSWGRAFLNPLPFDARVLMIGLILCQSFADNHSYS